MSQQFTSEQVIRVLDEMGFHLAMKSGSHAVFKYKHPEAEETRTVVVPLNKSPLATETQKQIAEQAGAKDYEKFQSWIEETLERSDL